MQQTRTASAEYSDPIEPAMPMYSER